MERYESKSPEETAGAGRRFAKRLRGGELVLFFGGMGAGKTTFCRGMAEGLGVLDAVSSPTFAIANYYRGPVPLAHFDAWRIGGEEDLETAGFYEYLRQGAVVAVEWGEKVLEYIDTPYISVAMRQTGERQREIEIDENLIRP